MLDGSKLRIGTKMKSKRNRSVMEIVDIRKEDDSRDLTVIILDCKTGEKFPYGLAALLHCDVEILN